MARLWLAILLSAEGLHAQAPYLGKIEGKALDAVSRQPLRKASIFLRSFYPGQSNRVMVTDEKGQFSFPGLREGPYHLDGTKPGYLLTPYGALNPENLGLPVQLERGEEKQGVLLLMMPQSALSGKILDSDGDPLEGVQIEVKQRFPMDGGSRWLAAGKADSNDRGEFRIAGLPAGKYHVEATWKKDRDPRMRLLPVTKAYVPTYYPGVDRPSAAQPIELWPGQELTSFRMILEQRPVFRIRGRFDTNSPEAAKLTRNINIKLRTGPDDEQNFGLSVFLTHSRGPGGNDGSFTFSELPPGSYTVEVSDSRNGLRILGRKDVTISEANLEDVVVPAVPLLDLSGMLRLNGAALPEARVATFRVSMRKLGVADGNLFNLERQGAKTFSAKDLSPDRYQLMMDCAGLPCFIQSIREGEQETQVDIQGDILDFSDGKPKQVEALVSLGVSRLQGKVEQESGAPGWGSVLALRDGVLVTVGTGNRPFAGAWRIYSGGKFHADRLVPGEYELFALEAMGPAVLDVDVKVQKRCE
jgi:hypothetical protein